MQDFSYHTHTRGFDGKNTVAQMVEQAEKLNWGQLGFSNHFIVYPTITSQKMYSFAVRGGYENIFSENFNQAIEKFKNHYEEIDRVREQTDIKILKGMEVDFFGSMAWIESFQKAVEILKPDYLIGSCHFMVHKNHLLNFHDVKRMEKKEQNMLIHQYYTNVRQALKSGFFDIVAHLDLPKKVGLGGDEQFIDDEEQTVQVLRDCMTTCEINTGYYKSYCYEPYPSYRILSNIKQQNIPIIISDDAHSVEQLGRNFKEAENFYQNIHPKNIVKYHENPFKLNNLHTR